MIFRKTLLAAAAIVAGATLAVPAAQAQATCELDRPVVFAGLDWDSNAFHVAVAGTILEKGYGCKTDAIPGSTIPLLAGMARGDIDVTMEIWKENVVEPWAEAEAKGQVKQVGTNFPDAVQGWFVPRYVIEGDPARNIAPMAPDLRRVTDITKYKDLFRDPEEPSKGRFYNCILGWGCENMNSRKLKAYGLDADFTNFRPGTGAALASAIASAYKRGKPIFYYYWGPTWVMGLYDGYMLEEAPYNKADWDALSNDENHPVATAYPVVEVTVGVNTAFAAQAPKLIDFLSKYRTTNKMVSEALAYMQANDVEADAAALNFLRTREDVWTGWVPADVAARVKAAL